MAYEELVRRYQDVAVRTAHLISPDGDAEDAVQDAFV
jgi:DNA-directed RNA polymerase specialized sigma24 family protein